MSTPSDGVVAIEPGAGLAIPNAAPDSNLTVKALESDTGGAYSLLEWTTTGSLWVPAHIHPGAEESWYVLEGELTFRVGDRTILAPAGSFVLVPRGMPHSFANTGGGVARYLEIFSPGGMERFFEERAAMRNAAPPGGPDQAALVEMGRRHGTVRV